MRKKLIKFLKRILRIKEEDVTLRTMPFVTKNLSEFKTEEQKKEYLKAVEDALQDSILKQLKQHIKVEQEKIPYVGSVKMEAVITLVLPKEK